MSSDIIFREEYESEYAGTNEKKIISTQIKEDFQQMC